MMPHLPAAMQKFLFDRSFDGLQPRHADLPAKPSVYAQADLDAAKEAAFNEGYAAGKQKHLAEIAVIATHIEHQLETLLQGAAQHRHEQQTETMDIALTIAQKLLPDYVSRNGLDEIQGLLTQAMHEMAQEPRLVVRIPDAMLDPLQQSLDHLINSQAFAGKIILLADDNLGAQDCRIEWSDGGIERNIGVIWQTIERLAGYTAPERLVEPPPAAEPVLEPPAAPPEAVTQTYDASDLQPAESANVPLEENPS